MNQEFIVIINTDGLITFAQCFSYEQDDYHTVKKDGNNFVFNTEKECVDWIIENIDHSHIETNLLKHSDNNFILYSKTI